MNSTKHEVHTDEATLIAAAQVGDQTATETLLARYEPAMRNAVSHSQGIDKDDAMQTAALTLLELIQSHDSSKGVGLAARVKQALFHALTDAPERHGVFNVPPRAMRRYTTAMAQAGDDVDLARVLANKDGEGLSKAHFDALHAVATSGYIDGRETSGDEGLSPLDTAQALFTDEYVTTENAMLASLALSVLGADESVAIRRGFGFDPCEVDDTLFTPEGSAPLADMYVGLSMGISRDKARRLRVAAYASMRDVCGVAA